MVCQRLNLCKVALASAVKDYKIRWCQENYLVLNSIADFSEISTKDLRIIIKVHKRSRFGAEETVIDRLFTSRCEWLLVALIKRCGFTPYLRRTIPKEDSNTPK